MSHVCNFNSPWPVGHPLPVEDPAKLEGPELGAIMVLPGKSFGKHKVDGEWVPTPKTPDRTVRVTARSYVWSPGECRSKGGYRHYDWSVVQDINDPNYHVCVNDSDLTEGGEWCLHCGSFTCQHAAQHNAAYGRED